MAFGCSGRWAARVSGSLDFEAFLALSRCLVVAVGVLWCFAVFALADLILLFLQLVQELGFCFG